PQHTQRGVHAHKKLEQLIIAVSGSFDITIDDGENRNTIRMDDPSKGLYICPMIWREIDNFSEDAVLMVLASTLYDSEDYIHDYDAFIKYKNTASK
ncbi:MAG TPA: WxcM-like domain-containing protein, partial [Oceanospirillales bacterium]|nr:WxcM-like domain-containing protein [Oceanospirillales bacterium]